MMTLFNATPGFTNSILTAAVGLPVDVQVISCMLPPTQLSPPFGEVTVRVSGINAKYVSLVSVAAVLPAEKVVLVTFTVKSCPKA